MRDANFALFNVDQLVTVAPQSHPEARGELGVIERSALAAQDGRIVWIGAMDELETAVRLAPNATVLNTHGRTVLPGFVDPHTHPVFAGDRAGDFYARALGTRYAEQLKSGGIMHTVEATRRASEDELLDLAYARADSFLRHGITTIEAKTGYGLSQDSELKSLRVLDRLQHLHPLKIVPAYLGAHVTPAGYPRGADAYVSEVIEKGLASARNRATIVDVWCDEGAFTEAQCRRIMEAARSMGFALTAHASELGRTGGVRLAAEMGALSVDHAVYLDEGDIIALRDSDTVAVLLPATTFFLGSDEYAPARQLLDAGVRVALGTDFNPGTSYTQNMSFVLTMGVLKLRMTAEEVIRAATINAAKAVGLEKSVGSLEPGKYCDLTVFQTSHYREIPYSSAMNLVESVVASGQIVAQDGRSMTTPRPLAVFD